VIIDELDRIDDADTQVLLADTIKTLSDNRVNTTLILVGVANSVDDLIAEHRSIERCLVQVAMDRMSKSELLQIIDNGLSVCEDMKILPSVRERIADYSQGLPFYTHMLAREAATHAVQNDRTMIVMDDLHFAIKETVDVHGETNLTLYNNAVTAPRGKYFKPVLLACALAEKDEKGFFYATNVTAALRAITGNDLEIPAFAQHLVDFSSTRGPVLEKDKRRYRFIKPNMGPYVILRGLADGLIREEQLSRPPENSNGPEQLSLLPDGAAPPSES
jgi:hypothetical protein